jgi:hypothetical protein
MPQGATHAADPTAGDTLRDSAVSFDTKAMAIRDNKSKTSSVVSKAAASQPPVVRHIANHIWAQIAEWLWPCPSLPRRRFGARAAQAVRHRVLKGQSKEVKKKTRT